MRATPEPVAPGSAPQPASPTETTLVESPPQAEPTTSAVTRSSGRAPVPPEVLERVENILHTQRDLDQTVWQPEVTAQQYEQIFIELWDQIRAAQDKLALLAEFPFTRLYLPGPQPTEHVELGIQLTNWSAEPERAFDPTTWAAAVESIRARGIEIIDTEWHHSRFVPAAESPAESTVSFTIHAQSADQRYRVTGKLDVLWEPSGTAQDVPSVHTIRVKDLQIMQRAPEGLFKHVLTLDHQTLHPILCHDLDGDNDPDIVLPMANVILQNLGEGRFERQPLFTNPPGMMACGQIADYDGDTHADLFTVRQDGRPLLFRGDGQGRFVQTPHVCAEIELKFPLGMTSGDIDADGDLDIWLTQRTRISQAEVLPQPYYDANNSWPAFLLQNDGQGNFRDVTEDAGLAAKRNRWTFLATLVDLDEDGDLDLVNMADFAGLDLYQNDGSGRFRDFTSEMIDNRHFFGMGLAFADFNRDARLDFYGTGMASTTARRLEQLGLVREDELERSQMRAAMGYGNRLYFRDESRFREDPVTAPSVARTGWAWGATSLDFDLDGDPDLYVANGYKSGASCRDYCTRYWTHDLYVEESGPVLRGLIREMHRTLKSREISWNGYEHNALLMNRESGAFLNVALLFDTAFVFDSRVAISEDFDCDGRPDLLVSQKVEDSEHYHLLHIHLNQLETGHNWIGVQVADGGPGLSPIGASVRIETESGVQKQWLVAGDALYGQESFIAHFGLGTDRDVRSLEVRWPNGYVRRVPAPATRRYHRIQPEVSSSRSVANGRTVNPAVTPTTSVEGPGSVAP